MPLCPALEGLQTTCPCVLLSRAFKRLLNHQGSTSFVFSYWIHVLVGDIFSNFNDTNSHHFENHLGGFTYVNKSIDIVGTFLLFYLWSDKCASSFKDYFFSTLSILHRTWTSTIEVSIVTQDTIKLQINFRDPFKQGNLKRIFYETFFKDNSSSIQSIFHHTWTSTIEVNIATQDTIKLQVNSRDPLRQGSLKRIFYETWCCHSMFADWDGCLHWKHLLVLYFIY